MRLPELPGYRYEDLLGEDPFGWTYVCSFGPGGEERRVVKVLKAQATNDQFLYSYLKIFAEPNFSLGGVAAIHDYAFQNREIPTAYAMPFFGWRGNEADRWQVTSLAKLGHLVSGEQATDIVRELASSLAGVHAEGLFHGGLRPGNIFLTGDNDGGQRVQISDFGQIFMGGLQYLEAGNLLFYASPEQLASGDFSNESGVGWDVYAFGVIAFQLLSSHLPRLDRLRQQCLEHPEALKSMSAIAFGELTSVTEHFLSQLKLEKPVEWPEEDVDEKSGKLREIIGRCLEYESFDRPASMVEVSEAIEAVWAPEAKAEISVVPAERESLIEEELELAAVSAPMLPTSGLNRRKPKSAKERFSVRNPLLLWQIAAVMALLATLPLSFFAIYNHLQLEEIAEEKKLETEQLKMDYHQQARQLKRSIAEENKNFERLKSELNEKEESRSSLVGQVKLARQILRQTQENGDQFFRLVLENRDTDVPGFREERAATLVEAQKHYERLVEVYGDAPDFIVSTANALFYLGQIYNEQGEFGKALASFGEAERRYLALIDESESISVEFVKNLAISKKSLGQLSVRNGKYSVARHYYTESSRYWTEVRNLAPQEAIAAATSIHENSLAIVECELAMDRLEAALDATRSIGSQLLKLQEQEPDDARIIGALAYSFDLGGRILERQGENGTAKEAYQQASDLFARAVKLNAAIDRYRLGLGSSLARVGLLENDLGKLEGAVEVLAEVVSANPYESSYQKTLADAYGVLARNQRDGGKLENAIALEQEAISILQPIIKKNEISPPDVLFSYAQRLAHLAELMGDEGSFDDSRPPLREAIAVLEMIGKSENALPAHHSALARARGLAGFACIKTGDKSEAKEHLTLAKSEWESYMVANPEDPDAQEGVQWTSDQLRDL